MSRANELSGKRFGRLLVLERAGSNSKGNSLWRCRCDCGNEAVIVGYSLTGGRSKSCGCLHHEKLSVRNQQEKRTHGETHTRLYTIWRGMRQRCENANRKHYSDYGGRGITVCPEWDESYEAFRDWAVSNDYRDDLTIDRIDNDKGYFPENCRWVTMSVQNANRRHYKHKRRQNDA